MKKERWHIRDIIDFEYFLGIDEREQENSAPAHYAERDRAIYLEHIQPMESQRQSLPLGDIFRIWLEQRSSMEKTKPGPTRLFPGEIFDEIYRLLLYAMMITGFIAGASLVFSFLNYRGTEPLNVASYLAGFVLPQVLLVLLLIFLYLIRSWKRHPVRSSIVFILISGLMGRLMYRVKQSSLKALSGSRRDTLEAVIGIIQGKKQAYGKLLFWPVFLLSQVFMVTLNLGVLAGTLLKVAGADIAFGWQSTIQFGARFVFDMVKVIALPWSWFVPPGTAYPALAQIEGSHMVLKEGIYHLATRDLVSWWPFLCLSLIFYGLLPRLILLSLGFVSGKKALSRINFNHRTPISLYNRMKTPRIETGGHPAERGFPPADSPRPLWESRHPDGMQTGRDMIVLIPEEIYDSCPVEELRKVLLERTGSRIIDRIRVSEDENIDGEIFKKRDHPDVLVLQEAWRPPLREDLFFFKELRKAIGKSPRIVVGLVGKPLGDRFFTQIREDDLRAWELKIKTLQDPSLYLERLEHDER